MYSLSFVLKYGKMFRDSHKHAHILKILDIDLLACFFFPQYFCCGKKFKVFLLRRPTDGSSEALQCSQNPLSRSLHSISFSHLCATLCTVAPQIRARLIQTSAFLSHLSVLDRLGSTSEDLLHLCLSVCQGSIRRTESLFFFPAWKFYGFYYA